MIIIITTTGMILAGLIYLLSVPVYFEIGYDIEQREFETAPLNSIPSPIGLSPKLDQIRDQRDIVIETNKRRKKRRDFV
jgi:hypothetical protein